MAFGGFVVQRDVSFQVPVGDIFVIMGGSGCGKSTLLKHMIGLVEPAAGDIRYDGESFWPRRPDGARHHEPPLRRAVPERRPVELDDAGRERGAAAAQYTDADAGGDRRAGRR